jgi:hypothetical protein
VASQYLIKTMSANITNDLGSASITMGPDVGQFWAVSTVRITSSTQPQFVASANNPYCAIYHGATSVGANATTFLDDTTLGSGDTSSIISGAITMYGDSITASWILGTIGDTVTLTLYGRSYDNLPELQNQLAPVPGARFAGTTANASVWTYKSVVNNTGALFSVSFPTITTPSNIQCEIISFKYRVTTSSTAGNRWVGVRFSFADNADAARIYAQSNQGPSGTVDYTFAQGVNAVGSNGNATTSLTPSTPFQTAALPSRLIIPENSSVFSSLLGPQPGDAWSLFSCTYRQFTSFTNVSFT